VVEMGRFIVMDIVFYGSSLNYDQGTGNYQELKKITKWDGRQYTLVSRYALRYSILETAKDMNLWNIADAEKLQLAGEGDKRVIQPSTEILLSGEILNYPEFDLFGYLITSTTPQNFRTAPVKISHAISMTPFNYDALFNANIGLANRMRKREGEMSPNPFTAEEHVTFYQYTVVVDLDNIGKIEVYLQDKSDVQLEDGKWKIEKIAKSNGKIKITLKKSNKTKEIIQDESVNGELIELEKVKILSYSLKQNNENDPVLKRLEEFIKAILNLKRSIKGRCEDLSPKLMVIGVYKNKPYKTYKDRIFLRDEFCEEEEITEEPLENGRKIKVRRIVSKKPVFDVILGTTSSKSSETDKNDNQTNNEKKNDILSEISEDEVINFIKQMLNNDREIGIKVFYDPSVKVQIK
jgi:CRISPR-associated protein Cst2